MLLNAERPCRRKRVQDSLPHKQVHRKCEELPERLDRIFFAQARETAIECDDGEMGLQDSLRALPIEALCVDTPRALAAAQELPTDQVATEVDTHPRIRLDPSKAWPDTSSDPRVSANDGENRHCT